MAKSRKGRASAAGTLAVKAPSDSVTPYIIGGLFVVALLVGVLGGWGAVAHIAGAVIAQGTVVVDSNVKKVQHPTGGVVGLIRVKDGDVVQANDLLIRLDDTVTRANLAVVTKQLDEIAVRQTRLRAEQNEQLGMTPPPAIEARMSEPELRGIFESERSLFDSRRRGRNSQRAQLRERIAQLGQEVAGLTAQHGAKVKEATYTRLDLDGLEKLEIMQLTTSQRLTLSRRDLARLEGEQAQLIAQMAQVRGKVAETELQILQIDLDMRTEVSKELRELQAKEAELAERRIAAQDQLNRVEIRAPLAGIVHQSAVHTVGGVIAASEALMVIVPEADKLVIEARISPQDIDQVQAGQDAFIRFTAMNLRTTPEVMAKLDRVSADLSKEQQTGATYYVARLTVTEDELRKLGTSRLQPGMPAEVQLKTGDRTALSYLWKPVEDQFARAFRER